MDYHRALVQQLGSSVDFLRDLLGKTTNADERKKVAKELAQAEGQLVSAKLALRSAS